VSVSVTLLNDFESQLLTQTLVSMAVFIADQQHAALWGLPHLKGVPAVPGQWKWVQSEIKI